MVYKRLTIPEYYSGGQSAGIYNVPYLSGPCLVIPLWMWLAKVLRFLRIPVVGMVMLLVLAGVGFSQIINPGGGAAANPGGTNHQLQFNANGVFGGVAAGTAGQVLCSNGTTSDPAMCDPVVSGPDAPGVAPTKPPVQVGLFDGTNVQRILGSAAGRLSVDVNSAPTTAVTGTFWQATQPVSGTFWQATQPVSIASMPSTPVTGTFWQVTQPVSGTVTATQATGTNLHMVCDSGCSSSTAPSDAAAFTESSTSFSPVGGYFRTSPTSLTTDHMGALGMTATRHLFVDVADALPAGTNVIGHVIADSGSTTAVTGTVATTQSGTWTVQPGNTANTTAWKVDGSAVTQPVSGTVTANAGTGTFNIQSNAAVNIAQVSGAASSSTNPLYTRETDGTNVVVLDPCRTQANIFKPISQTASAQLVTGTSAKKIYICSINLVTAGANNVAMVEGTGTVCATGIAGMAGGSTAATGWNFAANGGLTQGNGMGSIMAEATNADNLCLLQSAAVQLSGVIGYVVQ